MFLFMSATNTRPRVRGSTFTQIYSYHAVFHLQRLGPAPCVRVWLPLGPNCDSQNADRARNCVYMITGTTVDRRNDHREGILAKAIEEQTAKLPSDTFLWAAGRVGCGLAHAQTNRAGQRRPVRRPMGAN